MILHLDADSFFASCAQAINPHYRGKPLVTGEERGIATSVSYEAKNLGIIRGMPVWEIKRKFPYVIVVSSDYQSYSLFSKKMFAILRRFSPSVEEYSIDEAFADITGLRRPLNKTYLQIGMTVKQSIYNELGITVSVGIAPTKVLAKVASGWNKPYGLTLIKQEEIPDFLKDIPVVKIWGIGTQTAAFLRKKRIFTAYQFIRQSEQWVRKNLAKPQFEIWHELKGIQVYPVDTREKSTYKSISKTLTFSPPTNDRLFLFAQLSRNIEKACAKARRYNLSAKKIIVFLKQHSFGGFYKKYVMKGEFNHPTNIPNEMLPLVRKMFDKLYRGGVKYRATGVVLTQLRDGLTRQIGLFDDPLGFKKLERLYDGVDNLHKKFGNGTVYLGTSFSSKRQDSQFRRMTQFINYRRSVCLL